MSQITLVPGSAPATPATGQATIYFKSDKKAYGKDDTGLETELSNDNGPGAIISTDFNIVNNQSSPADITGLVFSGTLVRSAFIDMAFYRNTTGGGATEMSATARILATYKTVAASWDFTYLGVDGDIDSGTGQPAGVTLSLTSSGQFRYTSTSVTGTAATSKVTFRATTLGV